MTGTFMPGQKLMAKIWRQIGGWCSKNGGFVHILISPAIAFQAPGGTSGANNQIAAAAGTTQIIPDALIPNTIAIAKQSWLLFLTGAAFQTLYTFTVTSANATVGATYTNNGHTFTVLGTIAGGTTLLATGTGAAGTSGTLTKATGTGDSTITFSAVTTADGTLVLQYSDGTEIASIELVTAFGTTGAVVTVSSSGVTLAAGYDPANGVKGVGVQAVIAGSTGGSPIDVVYEAMAVL